MNPIESTMQPGRPLVLDGGLGSELAGRGYDLSSALWSAELIASQPQADFFFARIGVAIQKRF